MESGEVLALGNPAGVERPSTPLKARWRIVAADTCELCATRQKVKASAICFVLPSRLPLELGGEGSADIYQIISARFYTNLLILKGSPVRHCK